MRLGRICGLAVLVGAVLMASSAATGTTIDFRDAGFEAPVVPVGGYTAFHAGDVLDGAWLVGGGGATVFNRTFASGGVTYNAQAGAQFVALPGRGRTPAGSVTYTLTAQPNVDYQYAFYVGNLPSNRAGATVNVWTIINGFTPARPLPVTNSHVTAGAVNWQVFTGQFRFTPADIGGAASTTVKLVFESGNAEGGFVGLDSFSVAPCPRGVVDIHLPCRQ